MVPFKRILPILLLPMAGLFSLAASPTESCPSGSGQNDKLSLDVARYRDEVRPILNEHCGSCHNSNEKGAPAAALRIYDLQEENWPARMTLRQIPKINGRMKSKGTATQRAKVAKFVDLEVKRRRAPP